MDQLTIYTYHENTTFNKTEQQNVQNLGKKLQRKKNCLLCLLEYAVNCNNFHFRILRPKKSENCFYIKQVHGIGSQAPFTHSGWILNFHANIEACISKQMRRIYFKKIIIMRSQKVV